MIRIKLELTETWKREETVEVSSADVLDMMSNNPTRWKGKSVGEAARFWATEHWHDGYWMDGYTPPPTRPEDEFIDSEVDYAEVVE